MEAKSNKFLIIDSNSVIHRAFHALPPLKRKDGKIVNAVYGFLLVFFKIIKDFNPKCIVACFDVPEPTFRKQEFSGYKAKRQKAPDELYEQIPMVKEFLKAFNIPIYEKAGFEGDDIIGTLSKNKDLSNIIISGDLDTLQLVDNNTNVYLLKKGVKDVVLYNKNLVKKRYDGLSPEQLIDFKALRGDASDNIPGVKGIGEKTAIELIKKFKNINNLYAKLEKAEIKPAIKEKLLEGKENAFLSKRLATIRKDVPLEVDLAQCSWGGYNEKKVIDLLKDYDFNSLIKKINNGNGDSVGENLKLW